MTDPSTEERNKEIVRRLVSEAWTGEDLDLVDELVAEAYYEHAPFGDVSGIAGYKDGIRLFTTAFPDIDITIEDLIADGDRVVCRITARGTHEGEFMGVTPTGNEVTIPAIDIVRLADEQVVEEWISMDLLGILEQLDAAPETGTADAE